jgi:hypothetical protein
MNKQRLYLCPLLPPNPPHHAKMAIYMMPLPHLPCKLPLSYMIELILQWIDSGGRALWAMYLLLLGEAMADFL